MDSVRIRVYYPAIMRVAEVKSGTDVIVPTGTTIEGFLRRLKVKEEHHKYIIAIVNGEKRGPSYTLRNEEELRLVLPVGGG